MHIYFILFTLFILGACFGSFSTVLVSRWKSGRGGIMLGRSECPSCKKVLHAGELIPIISWCIQKGKCRKCKISIPPYYPISEAIMGCVFVSIGWVSMNLGYDGVSWITTILLFWGFVTVVYTLYDIRYMEIPDQIMLPGILITLALLLAGYFGEEFIYFFDYYTYPDFHTFLTDHIFAAILLYSFFFLQILIPGIHHLIRCDRLSEIPGLLLSYFTFPIYIIYEYIRGVETKNDNEDIPTWIGGGDLRIAIFIGLTLGSIHTLSTVVFAYSIGSIVGIILILYGKIKKQNTPSMIAFGPFLGAGWLLSLLFYNQIYRYIELINI